MPVHQEVEDKIDKNFHLQPENSKRICILSDLKMYLCKNWLKQNSISDHL